MQLILYYAPNACSLVPYVTLTEAGAPFEVHPLNFRKSQHMTPEYLRLNPKHKVPVLVIDGAPLTENVAIQIWIAQAFSGGEAASRGPDAGIACDLASGLVRVGHPPLPFAHQFAAARLRPPRRGGVRPTARPTAAVRELPDRGRQARRSRMVLRPFHRRRCPLLLVLSTRHPIQPRSFPIQELHGAFRADASSGRACENCSPTSRRCRPHSPRQPDLEGAAEITGAVP